MNIRATESARMQLRYAVATLKRRSPSRADQFVREVHDLLCDRQRIDKACRPFAGLAGAAVREAEIEGHRLFFREAEDTLWLAGVWSQQL
jgi:hypothetical protein